MLHADGSNVAGDESGPPPPLLELLKYESYNKTDFIFEINKISISDTYETWIIDKHVHWKRGFAKNVDK